MCKKNEAELMYEKYLEDPERTVIIDGLEYYKIITRHKFSAIDDKVLIVIPNEACNWDAKKVIDENGRIFSHGGRTHYSFIGGRVPQWYFECAHILLDNVSDIDEIGDYVTPVECD